MDLAPDLTEPRPSVGEPAQHGRQLGGDDPERVHALGVIDPPESTAALGDVVDGYRAELRGTPAARDAARFLLLTPPLPLAARPVYSILAGAAVADLPRSLRRELRLPWLPLADALYVRPAGGALTATLRWILSADDTSSTSTDDRRAASSV